MAVGWNPFSAGNRIFLLANEAPRQKNLYRLNFPYNNYIMHFIQKIEIRENEKPRNDKGDTSTLKIALLAFGLPGLVMLVIMCLILPSKIEYVVKGEPVKAELISVSDKGSRFSFYYNEKKYEIHPGVRSAAWTEGETFTVYVLNGEPYKARLQSELFFGPMFLLVMGGVFFYIGFKVGLLDYLKTELFNKRFWKEHPWVVIPASNAVETKGTVMEIVEHDAKRDTTINRRLRYKKNYSLVCRYEQDGQEKYLESAVFWTEPYKFIKPGTKVSILLDKTKSGKFIVDVNALFRDATEKSGEITIPKEF